MAQRVTGGPGVSASCSDGPDPANRVVRISITVDAQKRFLGREIDPETDRFELLRGDGSDTGKVIIKLDPEGEVQAKKSMRGSITFRLQAFPPIPAGKVRSAPCIPLMNSAEKGELIVRLPWRDGSAA